jgi:hypothetical protein
VSDPNIPGPRVQLDARDERVRTHITAVMTAIKGNSPEALAQPAGLFMSGMLTGLASSLEILLGGTAEQALETVDMRLAAAIGQAYLNGTLPAQPPAPDTDVQPTREEEIRGVQGWMAMDLHQALGLPVDEQADHQGHRSWADWWAYLCHCVRQRTYAELAHARALAEPEDVRADQSIYPRVLTRGLPPEPVDLFFPWRYEIATGDPHPATPDDPPYLVDLVGVFESDPLREATCRLIFHRSQLVGLVRDLTTRGVVPPDLTALVETAKQQMIREGAAPEGTVVPPLEALGYHAMGLGYALERAQAERDAAYRERAQCVALLAALTDGAVVAPAPDVEEPGWQIAYLNLGGRQASWHISPRDADVVEPLEHVAVDDPRAQWDGHTTEAKYAGMAAFTVELMQRCSPACAEGHTYTGRCESATQTPTACAQHPHAPTFDGMCGGCTQYPDDMTQGA